MGEAIHPSQTTSMHSRLIRGAGAGLLLAIASSCATSPKHQPVGLYGLDTIGGQPLPQTAWETETMTARLVADTMDFKPDGTGTETIRLQYVTKGPPLEEPGQVEIVPFTYTITGSSIAITLQCPDFASCAPPPHYVGTVDDGRITLESKLATTGARVFQKKPIEG